MAENPAHITVSDLALKERFSASLDLRRIAVFALSHARTLAEDQSGSSQGLHGIGAAR